jgi:hypothetical protein
MSNGSKTDVEFRLRGSWGVAIFISLVGSTRQPAMLLIGLLGGRAPTDR